MNQRVKSLVAWSGFLIIIFVFCRNKSFLTTLLWILAWRGFVGLIAWLLDGKVRYRRDETRTAATEADPRFNTWQKLFIVFVNYHVSNLLFMLNPFLLTQNVLQIAGLIWEKLFGCPILEAPKYKQKGDYILPVTGEWYVVNGGIVEKTSHSWDIPSQRFAYDLLKRGDNRRSFGGNGRRLDDYVCFDAPILSPADGVVVKVRDGIRDAPSVGTFWMDWLTRNLAGNSVLLRHAEGEYCLLAHLKCGSVRVKSGQTVKQGEEIARCGHSGNSTEPHLHFQFQNRESFYFSSSLPVRFTGFYCTNGGERRFIDRGYLSKDCAISAFA